MSMGTTWRAFTCGAAQRPSITSMPRVRTRVRAARRRELVRPGAAPCLPTKNLTVQRVSIDHLAARVFVSQIHTRRTPLAAQMMRDHGIELIGGWRAWRSTRASLVACATRDSATYGEAPAALCVQMRPECLLFAHGRTQLIRDALIPHSFTAAGRPSEQNYTRVYTVTVEHWRQK